MLHARFLCQVCVSHARPAQRLPLLSAVVQEHRNRCKMLAPSAACEDKKREISCHQVARPLVAILRQMTACTEQQKADADCSEDPPPDPKAKTGKAKNSDTQRRRDL